MLDHYKIFTVTHQQCSLQKIGQFVLSDTEQVPIATQLSKFKDSLNIDELLYLPTCNRVTYFFYTKRILDPSFKNHFFKRLNPTIEKNDLELVQQYEGKYAIQHLYEVASSINSMVVGEREILRQLRDAYEQSKKRKLTGDHIRLAMDFTVKVAKEVYDQTKIGEKPVSIVSLAIQKMLHYKLSKDARIILIGAGQTHNLVCKFLKKHQYTNIAIFNRNVQRAEKLAGFVEGKAFGLDSLEDYKGGFDALFVCTGATQAIVNSTNYKTLLQGEKDEKLIVDLGIPNNVEQTVSKNFDVQYIEIEDLKTLAKKNLSFRENEITNARKIIKRNLKEFIPIHKQRQLEKAMKDIPEKIKAVKEKAMNEVFKKELEELDDSSKELIEKMLSYMEKKCIGIPMKVARKAIIK